MSEALIGIIIGGILTLLGSLLPNMITNHYEEKKVSRQIKLDNNKYIRDLKLSAYSNALEILFSLRRLFDTSHDEFLLAPQKLRDEVDEINSKSMKASIEIRLHSTDKISNMYLELSQYSKFALSHERLFEESKEEFVKYCNLLAKLMRDDLNNVNQ